MIDEIRGRVKSVERREMTTPKPRQVCRWHICHDPRDVIRHAERAVIGAASEAVARRGRFDLAISGGPVISGEDRRQAVADWRSGRDLPASQLSPGHGVDVFADEGAVPGF